MATMPDHDELRAIRDTLVQILGEMKVANEIARTKIAFEPMAVDADGFSDLLNTINDIRLEHKR